MNSASLLPRETSRREAETIEAVHDAKPHVIMIAYHFPPAPEIGGLRPFRFRKYLERMGYRCHVITASPQAQDCSPDTIFIPDELRAVWDEGPSGRLSFEAWQELLIRKAMFPGHIGFMWSRKVATRCKEILRDHPRYRFVLYSTYPPMGTLTAGLMVRLREKIPWIADFRDPISGYALELVSLRTRVWSRVLESFAFRHADAVVANVEAAANVWRKRCPWAQRKLHVIYNGFDPEDVPQPRAIPRRAHKLIVHAGALYHARNPNVIVQSLARLRALGTAEAASVRILLVGSIDAKAGFDQALYAEAQRDGWLELRPSVPRNEAQRLLEEADGLLLVQPQSDVQVPGKIFEYICIGRPILALVLRSSGVEQILQKASTPNVCIYGDEPRDAVDRKLLEFLRMPNTATAPNEWFRTNFNAKHQAEQLAKIIDGVG
ncbi:MAG: glycosyltransferase [Candidatus Korobacteraceae bacterium]|jgi:glycosyltransferase involved in cell wall biosynthesis